MQLRPGLVLEYKINIEFLASFLHKKYAGKVLYTILNVDNSKLTYKVSTDENLLLARDVSEIDIEKIVLMKIEPGVYEHDLSQNFGSNFPIIPKKYIDVINSKGMSQVNVDNLFKNFPLNVTRFDVGITDAVCDAGSIKSYKFSIVGKKDFINLEVNMFFDVESGVLVRLLEKGKLMLIKLNIDNQLSKISYSNIR
ncbi:hypothetical protein SJAV_25270 [Sulfurisphaera javensis]|uniref:Uncharacterized protein n=1 Tax=Sulfurisphaera javensis TaxID=2049879 RepID=A0AAT9GUH9_9CREN